MFEFREITPLKAQEFLAWVASEESGALLPLPIDIERIQAPKLTRARPVVRSTPFAPTMRGLFRIRRFLLLAASLAFAYWATLSTFYLGEEIFGPANDQSYTSYLLTWIPLDSSAPFWLAFLAAIIIPALLGLFAMAHYFHRASMTDDDASRLGLLAGGLILGILRALSGTGLALVAFGGGGYFLWVILLAGLASITLPALLACLHAAVDTCSLQHQRHPFHLVESV
jgi:hypothetical protein